MLHKNWAGAVQEEAIVSELITAKDFIPKKVFFTKGVGLHKSRLGSFELALRAAKIAQFNLVRVSSIFPPFCKVVNREEGLSHLNPGQIVFCVLSEVSTNEPERRIASSIGAARPVDKLRYGYLSEHHSFGEPARQAGDFAEDLAAEMLGSTMGLDINVDKAWDARRSIYRFPRNIIKARNMTATATGNRDGLWTTCMTAAIFIIDDD